MYAWITVDEPGDLVIRAFVIPRNFVPHADGALGGLCYAYNWEPGGELTPDECADFMSIMWGSVMTIESPIGSIQAFATGALPANYLPCDYGVYNRVDYPELYAVLDTSLIIDGDTFHTPDAVGRVIVGAGGSYNPGDVGGEATHELTAAENGSHTHTIQRGFGPNTALSVVLGAIEGLDAVPTEETTSTSGSGTAHNNMQPYTVWPVGIRWRL